MRLLAAALLLVLPATAALADAWDDAYERAAGRRFIPLELWSGAPWDGTREIAARPAALVFGDRGQKSIRGPVPFTRPGTGESLLVYERINGGKTQLFAITGSGNGIGRVYDSRYGRDCPDEVKFPLGLWQEGERRRFDIACNGGALKRTIELTIEKLDFTYAGRAHALQFHWVVDGGRARGTDMHYIYAPGRGLAREYGNE